MTVLFCGWLVVARANGGVTMERPGLLDMDGSSAGWIGLGHELVDNAAAMFTCGKIRGNGLTLDSVTTLDLMRRLPSCPYFCLYEQLLGAHG